MESGVDASEWLLNIMGGGDPEFMDECGESLNLAVNAVADVLHTLCNRHTKSSAATSTAMVRSQW